VAERLKKFVQRKYPYAGAQLSAMHGWQIVDYGEDGYGTTVIGRSGKNELMAWSNAAARIRRRVASPHGKPSR
jgi:hypothetical protein